MHPEAAKRRFWSLVDKSEGCWIWRGLTTPRGDYGRVGHTLVHRRAYECLVGPIPEGLQIDHLCRVTLCVNPDHLEPVTPEENIRRRRAAYTHCKHGHEFTEDNTRIEPDGERACRACARARRDAHYRAKKRFTDNSIGRRQA